MRSHDGATSGQPCTSSLPFKTRHIPEVVYAVGEALHPDTMDELVVLHDVEPAAQLIQKSVTVAFVQDDEAVDVDVLLDALVDDGSPLGILVDDGIP